MVNAHRKRTRQLFKLVITAVPLVVFISLRVSPSLDILVWDVSWYTRFFQFYVGAFGSLVAFIVALFSTGTLRRNQSPRTIFTIFAFVNLSALLFISSIATPHVLISNTWYQTFVWSLRLAFFMGGVGFMLANIHWNAVWNGRIIQYQLALWITTALNLMLYIVLVFMYPGGFTYLNRLFPGLPTLLALITIGMYLFAAHRTRSHKWSDGSKVEGRLTIVLILLAEASAFQTFGVQGGLSWIVYHPVMLMALLLAILAILDQFETARDIQLSQYFAVLGSILMAGLALMFGELGTRWLSYNLNRTSVVTLVLAQSVTSFLILYTIVNHLNRQIRDRNNALRREQQLRSELTQLIVHDLKSPLTVITSGLSMMSRNQLGELAPIQQRLVNNLEKSGQQILFMIDDLLDVEKLEAGQLRLQQSQLNLAHLLEQLVNELSIIAQNNRQHLEIINTIAPVSIRGDKRLLQRVIYNLLSNALKFTPEEGHIVVSTAVDNGFFVINFADDGPGVPVHERERIFEKFAQVERAERRGAGLGLTFCKKVVEAHDGYLTVDESKLGGALFTMCLPLPPPSEILPELSTAELGDTDLSLTTP